MVSYIHTKHRFKLRWPLVTFCTTPREVNKKSQIKFCSKNRQQSNIRAILFHRIQVRESQCIQLSSKIKIWYLVIFLKWFDRRTILLDSSPQSNLLCNLSNSWHLVISTFYHSSHLSLQALLLLTSVQLQTSLVCL